MSDTIPSAFLLVTISFLKENLAFCHKHGYDFYGVNSLQNTLQYYKEIQYYEVKKYQTYS